MTAKDNYKVALAINKNLLFYHPIRGNVFIMYRLILFLICFNCIAAVTAQSLSGIVKDKNTNEGLISATVKLNPQAGKTQYTTTNLNGYYQFKNLAPGNYTLEVTYVGYKAYEKSLKIETKEDKKVNVKMEENAQLLSEVSVQGRATRAEQKGDSLVYNAEALKVMQGSSAEDLLAKMPGIVVEGGTIQAQGEQVRKVLVDGKEFFDGDVNLAIRNLPSDIIASILYGMFHWARNS